ncbi:MAG TPA: hypothetical protein VJB57_07735 [Dehalococcoidia bacterium]|nr:hypothetical protein [Dehalococcoidia bacterium]
MSNASVEIAEPMVSNTVRRYYDVAVKSASGEPVAGEALKVTLQGDGSLYPTFDSKEIARQTDEDGVAHVTWYRRNIWGRNVKCTLTVEASSADVSVALEQREEPPPEETGPRMSWTPTRRRF